MASMSQKTDEIKLENTLDAVIHGVTDIKSSIKQFLWKLDHEHEHLSWPTVLDNFALLSSQINSFQRLLADDKKASMKNYVLIPLQLSPNKDEELEKLTEGRVPMFNHEIVPDYLRTKPDMEVEQKLAKVSEKASSMSSDATTKHINAMNRVCTSTLTIIQNKRDEWKNEEGQRRVPESYSTTDTVALVSATAFGKGLHDSSNKPIIQQQARSEPASHTSTMRSGNSIVPTAHVNIVTSGKAQSSMKSTARNQYPYQRN